jgi:hypothetical protein
MTPIVARPGATPGANPTRAASARIGINTIGRDGSHSRVEDRLSTSATRAGITHQVKAADTLDGGDAAGPQRNNDVFDAM